MKHAELSRVTATSSTTYLNRRAGTVFAHGMKLLPNSEKAIDERGDSHIPLDESVLAEWVVTQSGLSDAVHMQQVGQMVNEGVDANTNTMCCSNVPALNSVKKNAYSKGVSVFSFFGYVTSPHVTNGAANHLLGSDNRGKWLADEIGEKRTVVVVSGIRGFAFSDSFDRGAQTALEEYSDIDAVGERAGGWVAHVAQTDVQKFLATNPRKVDGILPQFAQENGVLDSLGGIQTSHSEWWPDGIAQQYFYHPS